MLSRYPDIIITTDTTLSASYIDTHLEVHLRLWWDSCCSFFSFLCNVL